MKFKIGQKIIDIIRGKKSNKSNIASNICSKSDTYHDRPCHRKGLFVRSNGEIYPCCEVWSRKNLKIGHITDEDILDKIENYDKSCSCYNYNLIPGTKQDNSCEQLNIELSYKCQASCAMCCVDAPSFKGKYDDNYYVLIRKLIDHLLPKEILIQGGEILVQPKSIEWIEELKNDHPQIKLSLVTNGNNLNAYDVAEKLFNRFTISIVGFQPETYKCIMGLDINKTIEFSERMIKAGKEVYLKYLLTPNNFHELPLFLDWAMKNNPAKISVADVYIPSYIEINAPYDYWKKLVERTRKRVAEVIRDNKDCKSQLFISDNTNKFLNLNKDFLLANSPDLIINYR